MQERSPRGGHSCWWQKQRFSSHWTVQVTPITVAKCPRVHKRRVICHGRNHRGYNGCRELEQAASMCGLRSLGGSLELLGPALLLLWGLWVKQVFWLQEPQNCLLKQGHLCLHLFQAFLAALAWLLEPGPTTRAPCRPRNCEADPPADVFTVAAS